MLCFFYEKAEPTQELRDTANKRGRELCKKEKEKREHNEIDFCLSGDL